jgi:hypothetical protein
MCQTLVIDVIVFSQQHYHHHHRCRQQPCLKINHRKNLPTVAAHGLAHYYALKCRKSDATTLTIERRYRPAPPAIDNAADECFEPSQPFSLLAAAD